MGRQQRKLKTTAAIFILGVFLVFPQSGMAKTLDPAALKICLTEVRSQALQGQLIARAAQSNDATAAYIRGQLTFLRDKTAENLKQLSESAPKAGLEQNVSSAARLTQQVFSDFGQLLTSFADRQKTEAIEQDLQKIAGQLLELEATVRSET